MVEICASLLAANHGYLLRDLIKSEEGGVYRFHLDVCDGHYTENIIFGDQLVRDIRKEIDSVLEVHLAVLNMPVIARTFMNSGVDIITIQYESSELPSRQIKSIRSSGIQAGISFIPATNFFIMEYFLEEVDFVNILAVDPGIGGQIFDPRVLKKIEKTAEFILKKGLSTRISVDGGVNKTNLPDIVNAGANIVILGSAIFNGDILKNIAEINTLLKGL